MIYQTRNTVLVWSHLNTQKRVKNTTRSRVYLTNFEVFEHSLECLSLESFALFLECFAIETNTKEKTEK